MAGLSLPLPSGTVTFLFTDIEGSTRLWGRDHAAMATALARHDALMAGAITTHQGHVFKTVGDAFCAAFADAPQALGAAVAAQRALAREPWGGLGPLRVRMAIHTGSVESRQGDYFGPPLNRVARLLSTGYGAQVLLSHAAQQLVRDYLPADVSLLDLGEQRLRDLLEPERVFQVRAADLPDRFPPLKSLARQATNLPIQPTMLVGREAELAALHDLLAQPHVRLVTLIGVGGTGKTRLAMQSVADSLDLFPDGAFVVDLGPPVKPGLVLPTIAQALGVRDSGSQSLGESLAEFLATKRVLLLLDNFEGVIKATPAVARLLTDCPQVTMLVTSRLPLGVHGEQRYPVDPLPVPDLTHLPPLAELARNDAVSLFVQRARAALPGFALTAENAAVVAEVCARLEGLPLAVELAAAWVDVLPPAAIRDRIGHRLTLLTRRTTNAPTRQRTLQATIDWSYRRLTAKERALFRRLAVFAGGFGLDAAEHVTAASGADTLPGIAALIDKSLLRPAGGETARYVMLETLREYGLARLSEAGEAESAWAALVAWCTAMAERAASQLNGPEQEIWLDRLLAENDNVRAVLSWLAERDETEPRLRLATALWRFWNIRGNYSEGRDWLSGALSGSAGAPPALRAEALLAAGVMARNQGAIEEAADFATRAKRLYEEAGITQGSARAIDDLAVVAFEHHDMARAVSLGEQSLALFREIGDDEGVASALTNLGLAEQERGNLLLAGDYFTQSKALFQRLGDVRSVAATSLNLGMVAQYQGKFDLAERSYRQALEAQRAVGHKKGYATTLGNLVTLLAECERDLDGATTLGEESVELYREIGDREGMAYSLHALARVAHILGQYRRATDLYEESLGLFEAFDDRGGMADALVGVALAAHDGGQGSGSAEAARRSLRLYSELQDHRGVALALEALADIILPQQPADAVRYLAAAATIRVDLDAPATPNGSARQELGLAIARSRLGDATFTLAQLAGRSLPLDHAVEEALVPAGVTSAPSDAAPAGRA